MIFTSKNFMHSSTITYVSQLLWIKKKANTHVSGSFEIKANYKMQNVFSRKDKPSVRTEAVSLKDREIIQF